MNYEENYKKIIKRAKERNNLRIDNLELHHIIPRSLGGDDSLENLVLLTPREHYLAHYLLYKFLTGESKEKMASAFLFMSNIKKKYIFSSKLYERLANKKRKKVICLQTLEIFPSIVSASLWLSNEAKCSFLNIVKSLSAALNGRKKSCNGYTFEFYEEGKEYNIQQKSNNKKFSSQKKKVICLQTLEVFESARKAEEKMKISYKSISRSCINKCSTNGYTFEFFEEGKEYKKQNKKKIHSQVNRKILCLETNTIFNSLSEVERKLNIPRSSLSIAIKENKEINKYHFCFI